MCCVSCSGSAVADRGGIQICQPELLGRLEESVAQRGQRIGMSWHGEGSGQPAGGQQPRFAPRPRQCAGDRGGVLVGIVVLIDHRVKFVEEDWIGAEDREDLEVARQR
jgi:hypothetical protein